jgi:hypothetical protein
LEPGGSPPCKKSFWILPELPAFQATKQMNSSSQRPEEFIEETEDLRSAR